METKISDYRYERKFVIQKFETRKIEHMIKLHPAVFKEIFYKRQINNIYFDTHAMKNFHDNVKGISKRLKIRIRWYGNLFGIIKNPVLELKIKSGLLGKKISVKLPNFNLDKNLKTIEIINLINNSLAPNWVKQLVKESNPTVLNHYERKYFESTDKKFRITLDDNQGFYRIKNKHNKFIEKHLDKKTKILELKYKIKDNDAAKFITDNIKFRLGPSSKYVRGINILKH